MSRGLSRLSRAIPVLVFGALLAACGGGSGGDAPNQPPVADAGAAQSAATGASVALSGAASRDPEGAPLSYSWSFAARPAGSAAALANPTSVSPSFTPDLPGDYVLNLIVSDGRLSSPPASVTVTARLPYDPAVDAQNAAAARLSALVEFGPNTQRLDWFDSFPAGTSYRVQSQAADGSWSTLESLAGVGGGGGAMRWQRGLTTTTTYRVLAVLPGRDVVLRTPLGQQSVTAFVPSPTPEIRLDKPEPVSGTVQLSLQPAASYSSVTWYADLRLLGTGADAPGKAYAWNTAGETNGSHLVLARIVAAGDSYIELRRTVVVANSELALDVTVSGTTGTINVDARATSPRGIVRVEASFDGTPLPSLTAPNACSIFCVGVNDLFRFVVDSRTAGSGSHTMVITAIDSAGNRAQRSVPVPVSNPPVLTVDAPADGTFAFGTLAVAGSARSDRPGAVTVTAALGDVQFLQSTASPFSGSFSLSGVTPGAYTLTVRATDAGGLVTVERRTITVASSAATAYTPLLALGPNGQLLAADGDRVVYRGRDGTVRLRNAATGTEAVLANAGVLANTANWQIDGGRVYVSGRGADCVLVCVFQWSADGAMRNLSNANPHSATDQVSGGRTLDEWPVARGGYVIWSNIAAPGSSRFTLFDPAANTFTRIPQPPGTTTLANWRHDFAIVGGVLRFFFYAQTGGEGTSATFEIFAWRSDTQATERLTFDAQRSLYPQTDGVRVAWSRTPPGGTPDGFEALVVRSITPGAGASVVSTAMAPFVLRDGVLAWREVPSSALRLVKGYTASGAVTTISQSASSVLHGTAGGQVVYGELGKAWSWNSLTDARTLRIDSAPGTVLVTAGQIYFTMGEQQQLYRAAF
jgi:hypothetical protein